MAVYTEVPRDVATALVARLALGTLKDLQPCPGGIENTNYFVDTSAGRYVLTLFERLTHAQLPFYLELMRHLAQRGIPVPGPHPDETGALLLTVQGKPAAVVDRLPGRHHLAPDAAHCAMVGTMLARMHKAVADFPLVQPNLRGLPWWVETVPVIAPHVTAEQRDLLESELAYQEHLAASPAYATLPRGAIHADLFRDNVMFEADAAGHDRLTGFFDFYFAGVDTLLFDLAVCLNDWCIDLDTGRLDEARAAAFVAAYDAERPLTGAERRSLPALMRAGALRFWISRLWDWHLPRDAHLLKPHDPTHFERVLRERITTPWHP